MISMMTQGGYQFEFEFLISLFVFIASLIWVLQSYFARRWIPYVSLLVCVIVSGTFLIILLYQVLIPPPQPELPLVIRQPTTPL
jgi:hypothetical protein